MNPKASLLLTAFLMTGMAQATCYSVYKADGTLLQQSSTTPVNLALQIGDTVQEKFGRGTTMTVSDQGVYCRDARERQLSPKSLPDALLHEQVSSVSAAAAKKDAANAAGTKTAAK